MVALGVEAQLTGPAEFRNLYCNVQVELAAVGDGELGGFEYVERVRGRRGKPERCFISGSAPNAGSTALRGLVCVNHEGGSNALCESCRLTLKLPMTKAASSQMHYYLLSTTYYR